MAVLFMPGDRVRVPHGRIAEVELARQTDPPRPDDVVEVYFQNRDLSSPWPTFERWHPSHLWPLCAVCLKEGSLHRIDDELLCTGCMPQRPEWGPR